jgi:hypothetical protein
MLLSDAKHYGEARRRGEEMGTGLFGRAGAQVRQFICGLHGHDALLHFEEGRISLLCASCGHESPGWEFGRSAGRERATVSSQTLARMPLVDHRRVA